MDLILDKWKISRNNLFSEKDIVVIGDIIIDKTIFCKWSDTHQHQAHGVESLFDIEREEETPGAAAACAKILSVFGIRVTLIYREHKGQVDKKESWIH